MQNITTRLEHLEEKATARARAKNQIAVLIVREEPENIFTVHGSGEVLRGLEELHKFEEEHFVHTTIIDDIPKRQTRQAEVAAVPAAGTIDGNRPEVLRN